MTKVYCGFIQSLHESAGNFFLISYDNLVVNPCHLTFIPISFNNFAITLQLNLHKVSFLTDLNYFRQTAFVII
jgi:hypothetical protein